MDFHAKKSLGQNFLNNPNVPEKMSDAADVHAGDTVLEIGPGTGMLTKEFIKRGARVVAVEADTRAVEILKEMFADEIAAGNFVLHHADMRELDLRSLNLKPGGYKLIANIPYYLSGMLFRTFLESVYQPSDLVFLVQKEVAERIARDTKESLLSLSIKVYGDPIYVCTVKRGNFTPQPAVDSAIIAVSHISKKNFKRTSESDFFALLHLGFAAKRKQLLGNLAKQHDRDVLTHIFSTLEIPADARGEDLTINTWVCLVEKLVIHTKSTESA